MARVTVEDCLENVANRFELVMIATKRARDLVMTGIDPHVPWENDKPTVVALREIAAGHINRRIFDEETSEAQQAVEMTAEQQPSQAAVVPMMPTSDENPPVGGTDLG